MKAKSLRVSKKARYSLITVAVIWLISLVTWYLHRATFPILQPRGIVAIKEKQLLLLTVGLGLLVIVPVYIMTFIIAWRYRETNTKATYDPEMSGNLRAELVWWGIPAAIIIILSVITWQTSHALDPHKPLASAGEPMHIQVIALDWKWLFIYPDEHIASVNYVKFPVDKQVAFDITADAPMNSFWIPQLCGQIYAMPGMSTKLHCAANTTGAYRGSSANISGKGFANMQFEAEATYVNEYNNWLSLARNAPQDLSLEVYKELAKPSTGNTMTLYSNVSPGLYEHVIAKYMSPETK